MQLSKFAIGDRGTDSAALSDPKAFLFDKQKGLLVIPVDLALVQDKSEATASSYGTTVWQGAYVFSLTLNGGFELRGNITHIDFSNPPHSESFGDSYNYRQDASTIVWNSQNNWINRSLYIGNTLYTISNAEVKLNNLGDLTQIAQINLT